MALSVSSIPLLSTAARAQTAPLEDRYSGETYPAPAYRAVRAASGTSLSWPGKAAATAPTPYAAPAYSLPRQDGALRPAAAYQPRSPRVASDPKPTPQAPAPAPGVYAAAPVMPWYQRYGALAGSTTSPASAAPSSSASLPAVAGSIYDAPAASAGAAATAGPPASPAPATSVSATAGAGSDGETARFYSLHRQYGLTPDPDPIPPQFFTQTADLAEPPGPSPVYKTTSSSGATTTAIHPVPAEDVTTSLSQP